MITTRRIRRAIQAWQDWRRRRLLSKIIPEIMDRKQRIAAARDRHGKVKPIVIEQQREMLGLLRGGL
jgi:hypothetical protein